MAHCSKPLIAEFRTFFTETKVIQEVKLKDGFGTTFIYRSENIDFLLEAIKDIYFPSSE